MFVFDVIVKFGVLLWFILNNFVMDGFKCVVVDLSDGV